MKVNCVLCATPSRLLIRPLVLQVEELYSEVLYLLIHNVGSDVTTASDRDALCRLLQEAFKIDEEKHGQLMANVEAKEVRQSMRKRLLTQH